MTLLDATFQYVGIPKLREVPLAILSQLHPVPASYLKQLAEDQELFKDLPQSVKQQVRSPETHLFQVATLFPIHASSNVLPIMTSHTYDLGTLPMALA